MECPPVRRIFFLLVRDSPQAPTSRSAFHLPQGIRENLNRAPSLDGLIVLVDACQAEQGARGAAQRWPEMLGAGGRMELLVASSDSNAYAGCFTRTLLATFSHGVAHAGENLLCADLDGALAKACPRQVSQRVSFAAGAGGSEVGEAKPSVCNACPVRATRGVFSRPTGPRRPAGGAPRRNGALLVLAGGEELHDLGHASSGLIEIGAHLGEPGAHLGEPCGGLHAQGVDRLAVGVDLDGQVGQIAVAGGGEVAGSGSIGGDFFHPGFERGKSRFELGRVRHEAQGSGDRFGSLFGAWLGAGSSCGGRTSSSVGLVPALLRHAVDDHLVIDPRDLLA